MNAQAQTLVKEPESTVVIRFQDCDPFRHLNNARYIDYFMNAREDHLAQFYNFRIFDVVQQTNHGWVVTKNQIAYLSPAAVQEQVIIRTQLIQMTENSLVVEGIMLNQTARRLKAVCWIEFQYIDLLAGRSATHPDDMMDFFRAVVVEDVFAADSFNERVAALSARFRKQPTPEAQ